MPTLTAIVDGFGRSDASERCVAAIGAAAEPPEETIVLEEPPGPGLAAARNAAAERASGEVLVFIDGRLAVSADAFTRIRAAFGGAGESLTAMSGSRDDRLCYRRILASLRALLEHHPDQGVARPWPAFRMTFGAVRRERFLEAGGFDGTVPPLAHGVELGMRLYEAGDGVRLEPDLTGSWLECPGFVETLRADLARTSQSVVALLVRGTPLVALELARKELSGVAACASALAVVRRRGWRGAALVTVALALVNARITVLIGRRFGIRAAAASAPLYLVNLVTKAVALALGLASYVRDGRPSAAVSVRPVRELPPVEDLGVNGHGSRSGDLACVILSFRNEPGLVEAVQSVMAQNHRPEIVVVNSGGGDPSATLAAAGLEARLIDNPEPLYPGAARNVGIRATRSRFVSFLAADCRAEPGWAAMRLHGHRAGAELVASAMTNGNPESRSARAAYVLLHSRRMPDAPPRFRALYGLSYDRRLFERHGGFREDLRQGEDTEFRQRIESLKVLWAPEVRTAHWNPDRPAALVRDLYARGQRSLMFEGLSIPAFSLAIGRPPVAGLIQALRVRDRAERRRLLAASPLLVPAALAYAAGVVTGRRARRGGADRPDDVLDGRNSRGARQ